MARFVRRKKMGMADWTKWLPVVMLPFGVLLFETWLNAEKLKKDYRMEELGSRIAELDSTLGSLKLDVARLETMDRIESEAPDMGLIEPQPSQIRVVYYEEPPAPREFVELTAAPPDLRPLSAPPVSGSEGETCTTEPASTRPSPSTGAMARLCKAIAGAYASCFGHT